jgi:cytochrome c
VEIWTIYMHESQNVMKAIRLAAVAALFAAPTASAEDIAHGMHVFGLCAQCHTLTSDTNIFGPSLKGVVGRKAGSVPNYQYSQAMKDAGAAGMIWDDRSLAAFLYSPRKAVPGTKMGFWGLWTESEINDVIAFLKKNP